MCLDISDELVEIINNSWARQEPIPPYHIYLKMAYHLSQEARAGLSEFRIPDDFGNKLFEFQKAAVKIAAHHLNKRGGVVIGDVVGLGKTLMATALARIFEDDHDVETLIICPKNLVPMWEDYRDQYRLRAKVLSLSRAQQELPDLPRYRLVLIDESHNLRNREGKRYRAIQEYIREERQQGHPALGHAVQQDLSRPSNQLRLFIAEDDDIGIRPERLLRELGETEFIRRHQSPVRSLVGVREERLRRRLARADAPLPGPPHPQLHPGQLREARSGTERKYLEFPDGTRSYFPIRQPEDRQVRDRRQGPNDQYARLFADDVVRVVNDLTLPRYGLGNYEKPTPAQAADTRRGQGVGRPVARRQAADGLLPHQPVQAAGEQRARVHPVGRAPHPAQLRRPARHRERSASADRHPGHGLARYVRRTIGTVTCSIPPIGRRRRRLIRVQDAPACYRSGASDSGW